MPNPANHPSTISRLVGLKETVFKSEAEWMKFVRELTLSVVLSRPGTEVLAVQILKLADDGLWGKLSALGIIMIAISTTLVVLATVVGARFRAVEPA